MQKSIVMLLLVMIWNLSSCTGQQDFTVTNPVSTLKIQPGAKKRGPVTDKVYIAMAKGEFEPAQVVISGSRKNLVNVRISAGPLMGPDGSIIPEERVTVNPVGFVNCDVSTPGGRLKGKIPDVLLPNRAVDISAGMSRPFFITVQSTPGDLAGIYRGMIRIEADNASSRQLPLVVRVYDVTLPVRSRLRTAFVLWGNFENFLENTGPDAYIDTYIRYSKTLLAHRISPVTMWAPRKSGEGWDFSRIDRYLAELVPLGLTTFNIGGDGIVARTHNTAFARAISRHLKKAGWWHLHYVYGRDEAPLGEVDEVKADYLALVKAVPGIKIMQTGWAPHPELKGLVKIWCPLTAITDTENPEIRKKVMQMGPPPGAPPDLVPPIGDIEDMPDFGEQEETIRGGLPSRFFPPPVEDFKVIKDAQAEGDEVWWYVCCTPHTPYANLFIDYPGIDHRILGWMTYRYGIQGFLYWGVDVWRDNKPPVEKYDKVNYENWDPTFKTFNGDGYLLYPGRNDTAVPSLRLALLRDGFEDYDLFTEVRSLAKGEGLLAKQARKLLTFKAPLIAGLPDYTQDGNLLLKRREAILRAGEKLNRKL
ncbi:MAG: DUF4091 domain-containing protein [Candidatus Eremiobacteraeota bacterium]|nr:DUF4091 domain-containing protein [Candidatus Eremiobacteraeota bacterium]